MRSVWDGVYSQEQARRGERLAVEQCVSCHGDRLTGGESAPPLAGELFNSTWEGVPLSELADRIRTTMPQDKPSSLSRQQTADVVAYMLNLGTFPAGSSPLGTESSVLAQIKFESIRPQR
jgi:mono/diheme cytochrome c family protein